MYTQHIINDLRVRPVPCIEPLTVGLPRQLADLSRPLGILVEATIPGTMFLFRVLHHSAQVFFYFEPTLHVLHEIRKDPRSLDVSAVVEVADLFRMIHHPCEPAFDMRPEFKQ